MKIFIALFSLALIAPTLSAGSAKLIVIKDTPNKYVVQGMELTVKYNLFNIGEIAATDVVLADSSFPEAEFELVGGMYSVKWPKISAESNVTHAVVLKPLKEGLFNFSSAVVQYVAYEGSEATFGFSSEIGEIYIQSLKDFKRNNASHLIEWALFGVWCIPSLLIPYLMYQKSRSKYGPKPKSN